MARGRAEVAREEAVAGEEAARQLVNDLISSSESIFLVGSQSDQLQIEPLLKAAAAHCAVRLEKSPENSNLRATLTDLYGRLAGLCHKRRSSKEMNEWFDRASALWDARSTGHANSQLWVRYEAKINFWKGAAADCRNDYSLAIPHMKRAFDLWQGLVDEDPADVLSLRELSRTRKVLLQLAENQQGRQESFIFLSAQRAEKSKIVASHPDDPRSRKELAMTCLLLAMNRSAESRHAGVYWKEAYELYSQIVQAHSDDLMSKRALADCCFHLIDRRATSPYYHRGVGLLDEVSDKLSFLMADHGARGGCSMT